MSETSINSYVITSDAVAGNAITYSPLVGQVWVVNAVDFTYVAAGGGGTRIITVEMFEGGTSVFSSPTRIGHFAGHTGRYLYTSGVTRDHVIGTGFTLCTLPPRLIVPGGFDLIVYDSANINAGDTMQVSVHYELQNNLES
jgi:hypothetical protein